jgi:hypothetical protein
MQGAGELVQGQESKPFVAINNNPPLGADYLEPVLI